MTENTNVPDLNLWLDRAYWEAQNQLRIYFWDILGNVSNAIDPAWFAQIHPSHKGKKLARGNDLGGFPYQVLDLIRDFDLQNGLNIRVLNWFGNGLYIFVLIGKENRYLEKDFFEQNSFHFGLSASPWSYQELIELQLFTKNPSAEEIEKSTHIQWFKQVETKNIQEDIQAKLTAEIKKILKSFLIE
jgi:hypothetical protein